VTGLDKVGFNLELAAARAFYFVAFGGLLWYIARHQRVRSSLWIEIALGLGVGAIGLFLSRLFFESIGDAIIFVWGLTPTAFTFLMPIAGLVFCWRALRSKRDHTDHSSALLAVLCVFAAIMLAKIALRVSFQHYGFALAMPALFVFALLSIGWMPKQIELKGGSRALFRIGAIGVFSALVAAHLYVTIGRLSQLTLKIESPVATLRVDPRLTINTETKRVLDELHRIAQPTDTLAAVPEGAMLNVLSERSNPTGAIVTMPVEIFMFDESNVLERFEKNPPDWLVIRTSSMEEEYGARGIEYMPQVRAFLAKNYQPFEAERENGLRIYRRR